MTRSVAFAGAAVVLAAVLVAGAFLVIGSPSHRRDVRTDQRTLERVATLANMVRGNPPATLSAAKKGEYERLDAHRYRICENFITTRNEPQQPQWNHGAGRACFTLDRRDDLSYPYPAD